MLWMKWEDDSAPTLRCLVCRSAVGSHPFAQVLSNDADEHVNYTNTRSGIDHLREYTNLMDLCANIASDGLPIPDGDLLEWLSWQT